MFVVTKYTYLFGNVIWIIIWLILFLKAKSFKKQMLEMSFLTVPLGLISEFFYRQDYWRPLLVFRTISGLEDILFGFCIGGIAFVLYKIIFQKQYSDTKIQAHPKLTILLFILSLIVMILNSIFHWTNSIYLSSLCFIFDSIFICLLRKDLFKISIVNGFLLAIMMFILYEIYIFI